MTLNQWGVFIGTIVRVCNHLGKSPEGTCILFLRWAAMGSSPRARAGLVGSVEAIMFADCFCCFTVACPKVCWYRGLGLGIPKQQQQVILLWNVGTTLPTTSASTGGCRFGPQRVGGWGGM